MTAAEERVKLEINDAMATLERNLKSAGATKWEAVIVTYHPDVPGAWVITETDGASLNYAKKLLEEVGA